ncbi:MAG: HEPN domain-containing protein [Lentisphaerae bacterium]|jgi:HEPN domain-containing protein|nr:HEPN domain-containing protein [Lentisphaerota bacterium]
MTAREQGVAVWLRKAENDWLNVQNNLASARIPWDTVCLHAQQAVEKTLKALLVQQGIAPPRIHDVSALMRRAFPEDASMRVWQDMCRQLTQCAVLTRYEGDDPSPTRAKKLVAKADQLRGVLLALLETKAISSEGGQA